MGLKVAVIGLAQSSRHLVPWTDGSWELWGLAWDPERWSCHRTFEMHEHSLLLEHETPAYIETLKDLPRLYTPDGVIEGSTRYPFEEVAKTIHGDYFCSSIGFMVALAIHEEADEIGVWGVDMKAEDEYFYQRANLEYLIGLARGKGIKVHIPESSPVCKFQSDPSFEYGGRYGKAV